MKSIALILTLFGSLPVSAAKPNFIIIFTDDQGYADLGCFGSETIKTLHLRLRLALDRRGLRAVPPQVQKRRGAGAAHLHVPVLGPEPVPGYGV
jgi:hypothetical protein